VVVVLNNSIGRARAQLCTPAYTGSLQDSLQGRARFVSKLLQIAVLAGESSIDLINDNHYHLFEIMGTKHNAPQTD
jgi:hypothetical protein